MGEKRTIDLPFTPEQVASGELLRKRYDDAWQRVLDDDKLADVRRKLSIDDLRRLIAAILG